MTTSIEGPGMAVDAGSLTVGPGGDELPLSTGIARYIETQILDGVLAPGDKLRQQHIGETLGVSRTPVREALLLLEARGLVTMAPNRGAVVRRVTRRDVAETYLVRAELEALATGLAAERVNPRELRQLTELQEQLDRSASTVLKVYESDDEDAAVEARQARLEWIDANDRFHDVLLRASRCNRLVDTVKYVLSSLPRTLTWLAIEQNHTVLERYGEEHMGMIGMLQARDAEQASRAAREHVMHGREIMLTWLDTVDDGLAH